MNQTDDRHAAKAGNFRRMPRMKVIIEPDDGIAPVLLAIQSAKESIDLTIFRFDRKDIEAALAAAVARGVKVTALVAFANRGGEKLLRKLEVRFLQSGIIVARTADDLIRYHNKMMIIDRRRLCVLSFNFTTLDMVHSRGFAVLTEDPRLVQEAVKLFEADCTRTEYTPGLSVFVVSPANARNELAVFIRRARQQLLIYDPKISDSAMARLIRERARAGVDVRIIGQAAESDLKASKLKRLGLHTRTIIRDRRQAFVGSQSLRATELDRRREVGLIVRERKVVKSLVETFEADWSAAGRDTDLVLSDSPRRVPKKAEEEVARVLIEELRPVAVQVKRTVKKVIAKAGDEVLRDERVKDTVRKVVKRAVKDAVQEVSEEAKNTSGKSPQRRTSTRAVYLRKGA